jgi:hypothetical protein
MTNSRQSVRSGDRSVNVQVDTLNYGLTYHDAKALFIDLFKENFFKLREEASTIATSRAEEITDAFLGKLADDYPAAIASANDPDFQMALLQVQREYARSGDKELGDILVDMLVDRSAQSGRSLRQLVLKDALDTAPRLTPAEFAILTVLWWVRQVRCFVNSSSELYSAVRQNLLPFADALTTNTAEYRHLESCGCLSIGIGQADIVDVIRQMYQGLFTDGFSMTEESADELLGAGVLVQCLRRPEHLQVLAMQESELDALAKNTGQQQYRQRLGALFSTGIMNTPAVEQELTKNVPEIRPVINVWRSSLMKHSDLTATGIAIGHANWRRATGGREDVEIWLKDPAVRD